MFYPDGLCPAKVGDIYKADMHIHINALANQVLIAKFAERKGLDPAKLAPGYLTQYWNDLPHFHNEYEALFALLIKNADDLAESVYEYLKTIAAENCLYTEISVSLRPAKPGQPGNEARLAAIDAACDAAARDYGIEVRLIANIVRDMGSANAVAVVEEAGRMREIFPRIVGIGMSGDETYHEPLSNYVPAYALAKKMGFYCTVHAGETSKRNLAETMAVLEPYVKRLGHGVSALNDETLLDFSMTHPKDRALTPQNRHEKGSVLEICLTSNQKIGENYRDLKDHPLEKLWDAGYRIVLGSDDPGPMHTTIGNEYRLAHEVCGLSLYQLSLVTRAAIDHSFAEPHLKSRLYERVNGQRILLKQTRSSELMASVLSERRVPELQLNS